MSTWEERMAAKAAQRRQLAEQAEAEQAERELAARKAAYAQLPPCPCPMDPCPFPPWEEGWPAALWRGHRAYFAEVRDTGRCPDCGRRVTLQEAVDHDCPNRIALAPAEAVR
jgi:hypothetical protein